MATPLMMRAVAASSATVSGSPNAIVEQITPTIGTASNPSAVVMAGRLRLTVCIAQ